LVRCRDKLACGEATTSANESGKTATRRCNCPPFKARVINECHVAGVSVAKMAMSHGLDTDVVQGWRQQAREGGGPTSPPSATSRALLKPPGKPSA
jgi:transposase